MLLKEAECEKTAMDVKYSTDTKIEDNTRMYKLQKAQFDQEVNTAVSNSFQFSAFKTTEDYFIYSLTGLFIIYLLLYIT